MKQSVAMTTVLTGLFFLPVCFPRIYKVVPSGIDWTSAQSYCRNKYTDLATVLNEQDLAAINEASKWFSYMWIGLQPDTEAWRWSLADQSYYGDGQADFRLWAVNHPSAGIGLYRACVAMLQNGEWADQSCGVSHPFICYNKNTTSFIFVNVNMTWENAQSYCRANHTDLASVRNQSENDQLEKMLNSSHTWIGLYRNTWKWSDGNAYSLTNWAPNCPTTADTWTCGNTYAGKWYNGVCHNIMYFVCYIATQDKKVLKLELKKTDASVDMEELQEDILEKLSQRLKAQGLTEFKLRWVQRPDGKIFHKKEEKEEKENCATTP